MIIALHSVILEYKKVTYTNCGSNAPCAPQQQSNPASSMASASSPPSSSSASASDWSQSSPPISCVKRGGGGNGDIADRRLRSDSSDESAVDRPGKNTLELAPFPGRNQISLGAKFKQPFVVVATDRRRYRMDR